MYFSEFYLPTYLLNLLSDSMTLYFCYRHYSERFKNKKISDKYFPFALLFYILLLHSCFMSYKSNFFEGKK